MWYAPLIMGFAGSVHCIGMCGPLSSLVSNAGRQSLWMRLTYNAGRVATYGLLGAFITFLGGFAAMVGLQQWLSLSLGVLLLLAGFTGISTTPPRFISKPLAGLSGILKSRFHVLLAVKKPHGIFAMGMLNGLLPCGITWLALGYCVTLNWPLDGFFAMILFGLGTMPAMLGFGGIVKMLTTRVNISFRNIQTVLLIASGCILVVRTFMNPEIIAQPTDADGITICKTLQK